MSAPTRLACSTRTVVDHWWLSIDAECVRLMAKERIVLSIPAKNVVFRAVH